MSVGNRVQPATPKRTAKMANNQSLHEFINFSLPPRQHQPVALPRRSKKATSQSIWNKERFVHAHYRFLLNPAGDYTVNCFADPDIFFQWNDILQIIVPRSSAFASLDAPSAEDTQNTSCPICLSPPTAPRMTKCGHIFCFPCILHYLNTSENKWARCPICFDSVNERQLKCVKWYDGNVQYDGDNEDPQSSSSSQVADNPTPQTGSSLRMRLMQRPQITTLALPRSQTWPSDLIPPHQAPFHFLPDVFEYAKFMLATPTYLMADLQNDLDQIAAERIILSEMKDDLGLSFIDSADQKVRLQVELARALETPSLVERIDKAQRDKKEIEERIAYHSERRKEEQAAQKSSEEVPDELLASKSSRNALNPPKMVHSNRNPSRQRRNINPPPPSTSTYYFYQAASGLPIFLHPLDIKILLSYYSSYPLFPDIIRVRVDALSEGSVNDDLRKRCKYLAHMPEGADVVFVEADLKDVVGSDGLSNFENALKLRASRRKEKAKKDDRARARAEEREREKEHYNYSTSWNTGLASTQHVPYVQEALPDDSAAELIEEPQVTPAPPVSGAWGSRSFASALHSTNPNASRNSPASRRDVDDDEWDLDVAWHELEQRNGPGRRKRSNKLVVLGGAGGRRR